MVSEKLSKSVTERSHGGALCREILLVQCEHWGHDISPLVRAVPWCCRMQRPPLLLLLLTLLPQGLCVGGGPRGQRAEGNLVPATRISCRPAADFPEGVKMGNMSGYMRLMGTLPDGQSVKYAGVDNKQSYISHGVLGTALLKVTPGNEFRIDLYLVSCPCADSEECPHHPDPAKIKFVCHYAFGPKENGVLSDPFDKPANVSDVELSPAVCCKDEQCHGNGAGNSSAIYSNSRPSGNDDHSGEDVAIGVLVTFLVAALLACGFLFWKNRQLRGSKSETIDPTGDKGESVPMNDRV